MTLLIYSPPNWLYRGTQRSRSKNDLKTLGIRVQFPGLFDHLFANDYDLETCYEKFEGNSCMQIIATLSLPILFTMQDSNYDPHIFLKIIIATRAEVAFSR